MRYKKSVRLRYKILFKEETVFDPEKLIPEEIDYLLRHSYKFLNFVFIGETKQRPFLIKKNSIESPLHTFLVWSGVQVLKNYTSNIKTFQTTKPDIIFYINDKAFGIEIETGIDYQKHKQRLWEKKRQNDRIYGENWFILVASSKMTKQYKRYAPAVSRPQFESYLRKLCYKEKPFY